ncbi:hypothetical protein EMIT0P294_20265 [Pseudomonas sp. IT-P294]
MPLSEGKLTLLISEFGFVFFLLLNILRQLTWFIWKPSHQGKLWCHQSTLRRRSFGPYQ